MYIKVRTSFQGVKNRLGRMSERGQYILANQILADSNIYAPRLTTALRMSGILVNNNKAIQWNVPYVRKQYYALPEWNWKYTTPGTGPAWDKKAKSVHLQSWIEITRMGMGRTN